MSSARIPGPGVSLPGRVYGLRLPAGRTRRLFAVAGAFLVLAAVLSGFSAVSAPKYHISRARAIAAVRADRQVAAYLRAHPTTGARVEPLDASDQEVGLFHGPRVVLVAAVGERGQVVSTETFAKGQEQVGAALANRPAVLAGLTLLFLLATMVWPLRRWRNLDALVLSSVTATIVLVNARLAAASVIAGSGLLLYLIVRCAAVALRPRAPAPATPLLAVMLRGVEPDRQGRLVGLALGAIALAFLMVTLSSSAYLDVGVACLQGATELIHGVLPYGHVTLAFHGDTYPLLSYVAYIPGALLHPVTNAWSDLDGALYVTALAAAAAAVAIWRLAGRLDTGPLGRQRAVLAWLAFPPVLLSASAGTNDVVLAAVVAWVLVVAGRRLAVLLLAIAAWVKVVPVVLLPLWLARVRRSRVLRALLPAALLSVLLCAALVAYGGPGGVVRMLSALRFQYQRGSLHVPWYLFGLRWMQPLAEAATLCLLGAGTLALRGDREFARDPARVAALAAAVLLAVQFCGDDWSFSYLVWAYPFVAAGLFLRRSEGLSVCPEFAGGARS
ncbi:MAG TPA: glycosyltransferase 87 family protein [Solirubrobacteraceae bacterium]|jgi:hypothetical protein|nr:glycosyltransferase 87 family protein [Solirubrobacteraceae bacterium]